MVVAGEIPRLWTVVVVTVSRSVSQVATRVSTDDIMTLVVPPETSWTIRLTAGQQYAVAVAALNIVGPGPLSSATTVTLPLHYELWQMLLALGCALLALALLRAADYRWCSCKRRLRTAKADCDRSLVAGAETVAKSLSVALLADTPDEATNVDVAAVAGAAVPSREASVNALGSTDRSRQRQQPTQFVSFTALVLCCARLVLSMGYTTLLYSEDNQKRILFWGQVAAICANCFIGAVTVTVFSRAMARHSRRLLGVEHERYGGNRKLLERWWTQNTSVIRVVQSLSIVPPSCLSMLASGALESLDAPLPLTFYGWR